METKTCSKCGETKPTTEFYKFKRRKDGLHSQCKLCMNQNDRNYYGNHKAKLLKRYREQQRTRADKFLEFKNTLQCAICKEHDPVTLDFHHIEPTDKKFDVAGMIRDYSWKRIVTEMEKCIVLCKNCHTKVHAYGEKFVCKQDLNEHKFVMPQ